MIKIAVVGIIAAILAAWIKNVKAEYSLWIIFTAGIFLAFAAVLKLQTIVEELWVIQKYFSSYGSYVKLLVKIIGITYLSEFSADLCRDAGAGSLASQIELFGKLSILVLCMPVMTSLLETIDFFIGG